MPASRFKATCFAVMAQVQDTGEPVTITRHGAPIVRIAPATAMDTRPLFGRAKGGVRTTGDVLAPLDVEWDAVPALTRELGALVVPPSTQKT
jgi:prevent-host-death family protein